MNEEVEELKSLLKMLIEKIDQSEQRLDKVEQALFEEILNPINEASKENQFKEWKDNYGWPLDDYAEDFKTIHPEDSDIYRNVYDASLESEIKDGDMDDFIDLCVTRISKEIDNIRQHFNLAKESDVNVTSDNEGDIQIEVDGKPVAPEEEIKVPTEEEEIAEFENELNNYNKGEIK